MRRTLDEPIKQRGSPRACRSLGASVFGQPAPGEAPRDDPRHVHPRPPAGEQRRGPRGLPAAFASASSVSAQPAPEQVADPGDHSGDRPGGPGCRAPRHAGAVHRTPPRDGPGGEGVFRRYPGRGQAVAGADEVAPQAATRVRQRVRAAPLDRRPGQAAPGGPPARPTPAGDGALPIFSTDPFPDPRSGGIHTRSVLDSTFRTGAASAARSGEA